MDKLKDMIKREIKEIENKGINVSNLELIDKLTDIYKNIVKIENKEGGTRMYDGMYRSGYGDGNWRASGIYRNNNRMRDHIGRMMEGMDEYEYGRNRYHHGGDQERIMEGLEKIMYAVCMFVESAMDFAETPEEKEVIRKHVQKISKI